MTLPRGASSTALSKMFVLASGSPRRLALLRQIGITPDRVSPVVLDETARKGESARALALRLACAKAHACAAQDKDVVLAADTVVACGRRILPKASTQEDAHNSLKLLSGRSHRVWTGVCVRGVAVRSVVVLSRVRFRRLTRQEQERYVRDADWRGRAGAYDILSDGARFIRFLSGSPSGVAGLPLCETADLLSCENIHPCPRVRDGL